ncbi:hypothetical protein ZIOFF_000589 [Zingiber officinale]|uniref:Uncharacterized protein n=1 Tax=Zingiber officinale TaxID=94328 RepID=A0A8J5HU83_ZINOF|nr:hypothetical protein ZIOFF_000589 [Zingiber officinale]
MPPSSSTVAAPIAASLLLHCRRSRVFSFLLHLQRDAARLRPTAAGIAASPFSSTVASPFSSTCDATRLGCDSNIIHEESRNESKKFHSPLKVRSRGRPPTKRKQSKIEQIEKRAKAKSRKKGSIIDRKQDDLSNIEEIDKSAESQRLFRLDKELLVPNDVVQTMERTRSFEKPIDLLQMHADLLKWRRRERQRFPRAWGEAEPRRVAGGGERRSDSGGEGKGSDSRGRGAKPSRVALQVEEKGEDTGAATVEEEGGSDGSGDSGGGRQRLDLGLAV